MFPNVVDFAIAFVAFVLGVVFSQKLKDWARGIPSEVRAGLNNLEAIVRQKVRDETASAVAKAQAAVVPTPAKPPGA